MYCVFRSLSKPKGLVIVGDTDTGAVFTLNVEIQGKYSIEAATMKPGGSDHLGINSTKIGGRYLYHDWATDLLSHPHQ
jgi:hypothetical protein